MAYQVIKTVKGKQYLYEQRSYRVGKQVKTESRYLGAVSGLQNLVKSKSGKLTLKPVEKIEKTNVTNQTKTPEPKLEKQVITTKSKKERASAENGQTNFSSKVDLAKHKISFDSLNAHADIFKEKMAIKSVDPSKLAQIKIKYGKEVSHHKSKVKNEIIVTLPKKKVNRADFRRECFKAMAKAGLEQMEKQHPEIYEKLSLHFSKSFKNTQKHLSDFVMSGYDRMKFYKAIGVKYFGRFRCVKRNSMHKAERLGIADFSRRKNWRDEFCCVYSSMVQKGATKFIGQNKSEINKALNAYTRAMQIRKSHNVFSPKRMRAKRKCKRELARYKSLKELQVKASMVADMFF